MWSWLKFAVSIYFFFNEKLQLWVQPVGGWTQLCKLRDTSDTPIHWACLCYVPFVIWCLWITSKIWLLILYIPWYCRPLRVCVCSSNSSYLSAPGTTQISLEPTFLEVSVMNHIATLWLLECSGVVDMNADLLSDPITPWCRATQEERAPWIISGGLCWRW